MNWQPNMIKTNQRSAHAGFLWWRHQMKIFSALPALCAENSPVAGEFLSQSQWRGALMFYLICGVWTHGWVNNWDAGDLRCHGAHYDVNVMANARCWNESLSPLFCLLDWHTEAEITCTPFCRRHFSTHNGYLTFSHKPCKPFTTNRLKCIYIYRQLGPLLLTDVNFNRSIDK